MLTSLALSANFIVFIVSSAHSLSYQDINYSFHDKQFSFYAVGVNVAIRQVWVFPPRLSCKSLVSFDSL